VDGDSSERVVVEVVVGAVDGKAVETVVMGNVVDEVDNGWELQAQSSTDAH